MERVYNQSGERVLPAKNADLLSFFFAKLDNQNAPPENERFVAFYSCQPK